LNRKHAEGLAPLTVRQIRSVLRNALNQALRWGLVTRNVAALAEPPKVEAYEGTALTVDQARLFIQACRGDRLEVLFTVALTLGLRQGEALGLHWEDVDLEAGLLRVRWQVQRIGGKLTVRELKTKRSRRTLPLPPFAVAALREHRARQLAERLQAGSDWQDRGLVFTTPTGGPLDAQGVIRTFRRLRGSVEGLPIFTFHDTRRTCSSLLTAQGVHPRVVMEILGHTKIGITMETYTQVVPELMRDAVGQMERLLRGEN
jgi:integrase